MMPTRKGLLALFSPIQAFSRKPPKSLGETGVRLAPVILRPSTWLWCAQLVVHLLLGLCATGALVPHLPGQPLWWALLISLWLLLSASLWYCRQMRIPRGAKLYCDAQGWYWRDGAGERPLLLRGQPVVWPWLVVLRFHNPASGRARNFTLLRDSASADDLRRLRQWLLTTC